MLPFEPSLLLIPILLVNQWLGFAIAHRHGSADGQGRPHLGEHHGHGDADGGHRHGDGHHAEHCHPGQSHPAHSHDDAVPPSRAAGVETANGSHPAVTAGEKHHDADAVYCGAGTCLSGCSPRVFVHCIVLADPLEAVVDSASDTSAAWRVLSEAQHRALLATVARPLYLQTLSLRL